MPVLTLRATNILYSVSCIHSPQDIDELITRKRKALRNPEVFFESLVNRVSIYVCTYQQSVFIYTVHLCRLLIHCQQDKKWPQYQRLI